MIEIQNLTVGYTEASTGRNIPILDGITLTIGAGESLGLVGESGSGKSTLGYAIAGALNGLKVLSGNVSTGGLKPRIGFVQQNAGQALTPTMTIRRLMREVLRYNGQTPDDATIVELLSRVRLPGPETLLTRYPHELSGGQQQRILIALALARHPEILILDEPTTSLDASTRESLLELLKELQARHNFAMLMISHDLGVIRAACERTAVLYGGIVAEIGSTDAIVAGGHHPYTRALLRALPSIDERVMPDAIEGAPPRPADRPQGCLFSPRCKQAEARCRSDRPVLTHHNGTQSACFLPLQPGKSPARPVTLEKVEGEKLLTVDRLEVEFPTKSGNIFRALKGVSLDLKAGEVVGIIGESGSGKSTLLRCLAGLQTWSAGTMTLDGCQDFARPVARRSLATQRRLQLVFQNPATALNPIQTISQILAAPYQLYRGHAPSPKVLRDALAQVRLSEDHLIKRPKELSGGEKQRVALARGLIARPSILMLDEVTSALDVSVQAAVLALLLNIRAETGAAMLIVSHDIAVMRALTHRLIVLKDGEIVDEGPTDDLIATPQSAYTRHLIDSARILNA